MHPLLLFLFFLPLFTHSSHLPDLHLYKSTTTHLHQTTPTEYLELTKPLPTPSPPSYSHLIFHHDFADTMDSPPTSTPYSPPSHFPAPWSQIHLHLRASCRGEQYDRIVGVWLHGVEILRTSTAEPTDSGIFWNVRKDVTRYSSLLQQSNLTLTVMLENVVNDVYTGVYHVNITLLYYGSSGQARVPFTTELTVNPASKLGFMTVRSSDEEKPADLIIPVSKKNGDKGFWFRIENELDVGLKEIRIPLNSYKAVLEVYVSFHGNDEFWYSNPPDSYIEYNNLTTGRGNGAFRQVFVTIDGEVGGFVVPFPVIFTGGINPLFWEPVVAIGAFDLPSYDLDLSPFLGLLLDGKSHFFGVGVAESIPFWLVDANLHLWLDTSLPKVVAKSVVYPASTLLIKRDSKFENLDGSFKIDAERKIEFGGWVCSSLGNLTTYVSHTYKFENSMKFKKNGNTSVLATLVKYPQMALSTLSLHCSLPRVQTLWGTDVHAPLQQTLVQVRKRAGGVWASLSDKGEYHSQRPPTPLLDTINYPIHMKNLSIKELKQLAEELRSDVIFNVSKTGGHLGSSLGVVELTVALHYVFNLPQDKLLWDVGHQTYPHKILTGRRDKMHTLRQTNGLAGFTKRSESEYDCFGAGHSSTSISAALGMAVGRDLKGGKNHVVAVIGDGAMTAGQAYEAMNNAGYLDSDMIVILNDNKQVSLPTASLDGPIPPVGALSSALSRLQSSRPLRELREVAKGVTKQIGGSVHELAAKVDEYTRGMISGSNSSLFEELGLYYIGPVDGHNVDDLVTILKEVKSTHTTGPVLIHVVTDKGRGYPFAERAADKYHGVTKFDPATGKQFKGSSNTLSYTNYFAEALIAEAEVDKSIVAIHAAMGGGTGLNHFLRRFPTRCFDVGIAEQHAVTFAAGLACEGLKPFCAIYSSFLQRAYDQVVHDVDLQKLPVRFALDRAGLVGADGPTHAGSFDVTFLACLPNMVVMAPSDEAELFHMVATAAAIDDRPSCFRFPRGNGIGVELPPGNKGIPLEVGKGRILIEGERVALLGYGTAVQNCLAAAAFVESRGLTVTVADARFCKPLDHALIRSLANSHDILLTVEDGSIGGFGSHVAQYLSLNGFLDGKLKWRPLVLPDRYIDHGSPADQMMEAGMTPSHIAATVFNLLGQTREALEVMS